MQINQLLAFSTSYQNLQSEKMSVKLAYLLSQISDKVNAQITFYQTEYNKYLEIYAEKEDDRFKTNETGTGIILKEETKEEAHEKFNELDSYNFEIEFNKIPFSLFDNLQISPQTLKGLLPFLDEEN